MVFARLACGLAMELLEVGGTFTARPLKAASSPRSDRDQRLKAASFVGSFTSWPAHLQFACLGVLFHRACDEHESICGAGIETAVESDRAHFDIKFDIIGPDPREFRIEQP